jgi:hypothetical protein
VLQLTNLESLAREHDHFLARQERILHDTLEEAGDHAKNFVIDHPGFEPRTGDLQKATKARVVRMSNGRVLRITNASPYAGAIDGGARAHVITPKSGKFLRFIGRNGKTVFARRVNHPGNKPYRFLYRATMSASRVWRADAIRRLTALARSF